MKVFYHNDNDGKCAAHLIYAYYNIDPPDVASEIPITFISMEYGKPFPFSEIAPNEKVYIVDFSIEPQEMEELLQITEDVIWIDHHKTALEKYNGMFTELDGLRSVSLAGCENTWKYLHEDEEIPYYVALIGDRDTWRWEYGDETKFFHYGMLAYDNKPTDAIWLLARCNTAKIIRKGKAVWDYVKTQNEEALEKRGFWFSFQGYRTFALNSDTVRSSEFFEQVVPEAEVWLVFRYMPKSKEGAEGYFSVSLYSHKVDVSEIATKYVYEGKRGAGIKELRDFK